MKIKYYEFENNLVNLSNSLLKRFGVKTFHPSLAKLDPVLAEKSNVCVLLFDAMGQALVRDHLSEGSFLRRHFFHTITSTFPSTTVAATNALLSGRFPQETGWLGWTQYFKEIGSNVDVFMGRKNLTKEVAMTEDQVQKEIGYRSIFDLIREGNPTLHVGSVWPAIKPGGAKDLPEFFKQLETQLSIEGPKFLYGYWLEPDYSIHQHGVHSLDVRKIIHDINHRVELLTKKHLDTLFIVLADHGQIDVTFLDVAEHRSFYSTLERTFSLEPRAAVFYVKKGQKKAFEESFHRYYGRYFMLKTAQEVHDEHWFGFGPPHRRFKEFIGDYLAIAVDQYCFDNRREGGLANKDKKAHHAGMTEDEMAIDLAVMNR